MTALRRRALITIVSLWAIYGALAIYGAATATRTLCAFDVCGEPYDLPFAWAFLLSRLIVTGVIAAIAAAFAVLWLRPTVTDATADRLDDSSRLQQLDDDD